MAPLQVQLLKATYGGACTHWPDVYEEYIQSFIKIGRLISVTLASVIETVGGRTDVKRQTGISVIGF
jgi:hypothetical protein